MAESIHHRRKLARAQHFGFEVAEEVADEDQVEESDETDPVDGFHIGGGWYEIDGEKVQGKDAARDLLNKEE